MGAQTDRIVKIENLLRRHRLVNFQTLLNELEVSPATIKRDLTFLRDRLGCPIVYDRAEDTYRLDTSAQVGQRHEIPGLWFSAKELHALLTAHQLLSDLDPNGALNRHVGPLLERIHQLVGQSELDKIDVMQRIRVVNAGRRPVEAPCFEAACSALLGRKKLSFRYFTRSRQAESRREASPQRLIHYRNTWYMDAWCHKNNDLRRFALDAMAEVQVSDEKAKEVALSTVAKTLDGGYGIYAGNKVQWARLRFSALAAQWVAREQWHPDQQLHTLEDERIELKLPFVDMVELSMDILRHGPEVEVLEPKALRDEVHKQLRLALATYADQ
ncbi:WYL domain-containing protein [Aquabacterium sp.]|uniref:helix-turn-helix transcriptional regulator n=1 Tax=Aquabacterium sp. TaxID=1872578 RepID=UPI00248808C0|nr:WYL domain-containing protein [Aquabacterium sp.]MDI1349856.1 WYL domain-containing protein [Aquabacterium sp.]